MEYYLKLIAKVIYLEIKGEKNKMKRKIVGIFVMTLLIGAVASQVSACTGFTFNDEDNVFACHNEDWHDFFTLRFFPATEDRYGTMFIEVWDDTAELLLPFSGMNDKGLWYSMYGTPYLEQKNNTDLPSYNNQNTYYKYHEGELMLYECETIEEALENYNKYNHNHYGAFQVLMADGTGNSVIYEGDFQFYKEGNYQVVSNFHLSHPELGGLGNSFERYDIAISMLENISEPSVEYFRDICNATHQEGSNSWTCHSIICDLSNQIMYVYYFGDYEKQVVIDLNEELKKGEHSLLLGSLFEPEGNQPPTKPETPTGNVSGVPGEVIDFKTGKTSDPDEDSRISYMWDWGDGNQSVLDYPRYGFFVTSSYSWAERGTYEVRVKAIDQYGAESEWSDPLVVTMPKTKSIENFNPWLLRLIQRFPILEILV